MAKPSAGRALNDCRLLENASRQKAQAGKQAGLASSLGHFAAIHTASLNTPVWKAAGYCGK